MATLYTSNLETVKEATVNLDTWVKVKEESKLKNLPFNHFFHLYKSTVPGFQTKALLT